MMLPLLLAALGAAASIWSTTVPFVAGQSVTLDARAGSLMISTLEMADRSDSKRTGASLTLTVANTGNKDEEAVFTATLLDAQGGILAADEDSMEIEEGDVKKVRFRLTLPEGKQGPIASVKLEVKED